MDLKSLYPLLGSENGGTPLLIAVDNLLTDPTLYESPLKCRYELDYSPSDPANYYYTDATILSAVQVTCLTPDISALELFKDEPVSVEDNYRDIFVSVSEIDGQFKTFTQQRFTVVKHTAVRYLEPSSGWESQEQLVNVKVTSALPEPSLLVRIRTYATEHAPSRIIY